MSTSGIKQVEVQIMSQSYMLACPADGEEALHEAVAKVDSAMCRIRDAGKVKARDRIAVLAALNIAFELMQKGATFPSSSFGNTESGELTDAQGQTPTEVEARLKGLLSRLDRALADDGRLI